MTFKRHLQGEAERSNKFRLTLPLTDLPALDDAQRVPELRDKARAQAQTDCEIQTIVHAMLCTQFFLELDSLPTYVGGSWEVRATIRCRSPNPRAVVRRLLEEYTAAAFVKDKDCLLAPVEELDICEDCGLYRRRVRFAVRDLDEDVGIAVQSDETRRWSISAFQPSRKMRWFVERQGLDSPFGSADHVNNSVGDGRPCGCVSRRRGKFVVKVTSQSSKSSRSVCMKFNQIPVETTKRSPRLGPKRSLNTPLSPVEKSIGKGAPPEVQCLPRKRKASEEVNMRAPKKLRSQR